MHAQHFAQHFALAIVLSVLLAACGGAPEPETAVEDTAALPACDPDNGGITLPDGFCAAVVADGLGVARHIAVTDSGDIYVALRTADEGRGGIVALRDTTGDGRADVREYFSDKGGTGLRIRDGYLYFAYDDLDIVRYRLTPGQLVPDGPPEVMVSGLPDERSHRAKGIAWDPEGNLYVNVGAPSNACEDAPTRTPETKGQDPCGLLERHGGIWRFADEPGQTQIDNGYRFGTGMRQVFAIAWHPSGTGLWAVQHGRDQLDTLWPGRFTEEENAELPSEEFFLVEDGSDFGWPYCYHDPFQNKRVLAPEYGGDGTMVGRCDQYQEPVMAFPAHWAPNDLMFYTGTQLPERYRNGAFIAWHGSWNRAPLPQRGYKVTFVPFGADGHPAGDYEVFADGFAGVDPIPTRDDAQRRPMGLAQGPDGSLYITDSRQGHVWRVMYRGGAPMMTE